MGLLDMIGTALLGAKVADEIFYEVIARELANGIVRPGLWTKALSETNFEEGKAKTRYVQLRLAALKLEVAKLVHIERTQTAQLPSPEAQCKELLVKATEAHSQGDFGTALTGFTLLSEQGVSEAQNYLGYMLENGQGTNRDLDKAPAYYQEAAAQNNPDAQYHLGRVYLHALYKYEDSCNWLVKAERNGHPDAPQLRSMAGELLRAERRLRS